MTKGSDRPMALRNATLEDLLGEICGRCAWFVMAGVAIPQKEGDSARAILEVSGDPFAGRGGGLSLADECGERIAAFKKRKMAIEKASAIKLPGDP